MLAVLSHALAHTRAHLRHVPVSIPAMLLVGPRHGRLRIDAMLMHLALFVLVLRRENRAAA
jgi:hypothetical protein